MGVLPTSLVCHSNLLALGGAVILAGTNGLHVVNLILRDASLAFGSPQGKSQTMMLQCRCLSLCLSIVLILGLCPLGGAEDWPMWRYNAGHTAISPEELPVDLHLQWVLELPTPRACWPATQYRMLFDQSYEPVVMGSTLFVPSMIHDCVSAYRTETGELTWRFFADGPVRFAPVVTNGKVYFVSDDGHLYCLDADQGTLLWKFRGGPSDYKLLGNARLISMWPARGAPVLYDGTIYFAASIWPFMGTFVHALNAETGEVVWTNSGSGSDFMLQPHSSPAFAGVAPQGYLSATEDKLFLAGGRSVPAAYDRHTGKFLYFETNTKDGGYEVIVGKEWFLNAGSVYETANGGDAGSLQASILTDNAGIGIKEDGRIIASTLDAVWKEYTDRRGRKQRRRDFAVLWEKKTPFEKIFLLAGSRLYCGASGVVGALDAPSVDTDPPGSISWQSTIEGEPWSMLAANGKLFVVTEEGRIYCFGGDEAESKVHKSQIVQESHGNDRWTQQAKELLNATDVRDGYALVLGVGTGRLTEELARQSNLHIIAIDPDAEKIESLRRTFLEKGLYGQRIALLEGDILSIPLAPYFASLVVSEDIDAAGFGRGGSFAKDVFHVLRPYGGVACFSMDRDRQSAFVSEVDEHRLPNAEVKKTETNVSLVRAGALPGSAPWTHQYGDVANSIFSRDQRVRSPLGLLWFGGPSHSDVLPRHGHGPPQQVVGGRLFIQGIGVMSARDVYTGRVLWRKELPDLNTFGMYYNETYVPDPYDRTYNQRHIPGANEFGTNFIVTPDRIYLVQEKVCLVMDPSTGETLHEWTFPTSPKQDAPNWGYIGVYEDLLIAGAVPFRVDEKDDEAVVEANHRFGRGSRYLVVMDRYNGSVQWVREAAYNFRHNTIVAGNGKVFCLDSMSEARLAILRRRGLSIDAQPQILALDIRTGDELWNSDENIFGTWLGYSEEHDVLLQAGSRAGDRARDEVGRGMAAYNGSSGELLWNSDVDYAGPCILYHDRIITQTGGGNQSASSALSYNLLTGEPIVAKHPLTGETIPWGWVRFKGCNTAVCSEHLLTFRSASGAYIDFSKGLGTSSIGGFRSSCTSNLVAADGVLNAPDYTRTCTCSYQNQTSLAFVYMPEGNPKNPYVEGWSFNHYPAPEKPAPIEHVGINFGAPGNRTANDGTLWIEFPSVGGPSPDIPIRIESDDVRTFRHHASRIERPAEPAAANTPNWVSASGVEGELAITVRVFLQSAGDEREIRAYDRNVGTSQLVLEPSEVAGSHETPRPYTVRLHFSEPQDLQTGARVFDVYLQDEKVLDQFDIVTAAGGSDRAIALDFEGVMVKDDLRIAIRPSQPNASHMPVLCGVEVHAEKATVSLSN